MKVRLKNECADGPAIMHDASAIGDSFLDVYGCVAPFDGDSDYSQDDLAAMRETAARAALEQREYCVPEGYGWRLLLALSMQDEIERESSLLAESWANDVASSF